MKKIPEISVSPVWGRLIVLPDNIENTNPELIRARKLGLDVSHVTNNEREQMSQVEGLLVAAGGNCFENWKGLKPGVGSKVLFDKYAGCTKAIDGIKYRIISDTDILAVCK